MALTAVQGAVTGLAESYDKLSSTQKTMVLVAGGATTVALLSRVMFPHNASKPTSFQLSGGAVANNEVQKEFDAYAKSYSGGEITDRSQTVHLVDVFYSLVTDLYEWGWGQSFHFSPQLPHKGLRESEVAHETRIAAVLGLKPGMKALDCGCGVGGPMRTIAAVSGAHVTGITINEYQVNRAKSHNAKQGLAPITDVVRGDFTNMPFEPNTFDAAYAIEATCHANKLEDVYKEVFRVLKPGGMFATYEWVATKRFDPANPAHVKILDDINFGNGLPETHTVKDAENAGKNVGLQLLTSIDMAEASIVCGPWYDRLRMNAFQHHINGAIVNTLDALRLAPKGLKDVHHVLKKTAADLIAGGEQGIFTPMHMLVFKKPEGK